MNGSQEVTRRSAYSARMQNNSTSPAKSFLSKKKIPPRERLIVALDVGGPGEALALVEKLGDSVLFYKLGLQMFMAGGYFELADKLTKAGKKVFVDLKFFDVPQTVGSAVKALTEHQVAFATVHGNDGMLKAACEVKGSIKILAVTVLTSLDQHDMDALGFKGVTIPEIVISRAKRAVALGCDGVIASGQEAAQLREQVGDHFLIVTPGIRPIENRLVEDDQKRTVTPEMAFKGGADYLVVGRPIIDASDPRAAAEEIQKTIASLFGG
jgi:orotidine-5'-phosphate decarboxylase